MFKNFKTECVDTPNWEDGHGYNCVDYKRDYCDNGMANPGNKSILSSSYNYPHENCCACGKGRGGKIIYFFDTWNVVKLILFYEGWNLIIVCSYFETQAFVKEDME